MERGPPSPPINKGGSDWLKDISTPDFSTPSFNPRPFNPRFFNHELFNPGLFNPRLFNQELSNPRVENSGVEKSGVGKFMVEKSRVERSWVEAWGWKVWGWNVLQPSNFGKTFGIFLTIMANADVPPLVLHSEPKIKNSIWELLGKDKTFAVVYFSKKCSKN